MMQTKLYFTLNVALLSFSFLANARASYQVDLTQRVFLIEKVNYTPSAQKKYPNGMLVMLENEIKTCGISLRGPTCLDSQFLNQDNRFYGDSTNTIPTTKSRIYLSPFSQKGSNLAFLLKLEVSSDKNQPTFQSAALYLIQTQNLENREALKNDFLLNRLEKIAELTIPSNGVGFASAALATETDNRRLYHLTQYLLAADKKKVLIPQLKAALSSKTLIISKSSLPYQKAFLEILRDAFSQEKNLLVAIAEKLVSSISPDVSQLAAITLSERGINNEKIKALLRQATKNNNWNLRLLAISALKLVRSELKDDEAILLGMGDSDNDVRETAWKAAAGFTLTEQHLPLLIRLTQHENWETRQQAVSCIGRISTPQATTILLEQIMNSDNDVRKEAVLQVNKHPLTAQDIPKLKMILQQNNWEIRLEGVKQLQRLNSPNAFLALIPQLADSDQDVQQTVFQILSQVKLQNLHGASLSKLLQSNSWEVRKNAIHLLGKISSAESTAAILSTLADSDEDVRKEANSQLSHKMLSNQNLTTLQKITSDPNWQIRQLGVQQASKIQTDEATSLLIRLLNESDEDVRKSLEQALQNRQVNQNHIKALEQILNQSSQYQSRMIAVKLLGTNSSSQARSILRNRLQTETDDDVISIIKTELSHMKN